MGPISWHQRLKTRVAGILFLWAGALDDGYRVYVDDARPRRYEDEPLAPLMWSGIAGTVICVLAIVGCLYLLGVVV